MRRTIIILILAVLLAGCGGGRTLSRQLGELDATLDQYGQALRWARYKDAERLQTTPAGKVIPIDVDAMERIRITGYSIESKTIVETPEQDKDYLQVEVQGEFQYYSTSSGTLRKAPFKQLWWFDQEGKHWLLNGGVPEFK